MHRGGNKRLIHAEIEAGLEIIWYRLDLREVEKAILHPKVMLLTVVAGGLEDIV